MTTKNKGGTIFVRGPMGDFVAGDKQFLSSLACPMPGPADYVSSYKPKSGLGEWSVVGKPKDLPVSAGPPPSRYYTGGNLSWAKKNISIKGQGKTCPVGPRHYSHMTPSQGPNAYNVQYGNTGHLSQKHSIGIRTALAVSDIPGPAYLAPDDRAKSFTIGVPLPRSDETAGSGPAGYDPPQSLRGAEHVLAHKLDNEVSGVPYMPLPRFYGWDVGFTPFRKNVEDSPGPIYNTGTTMGDGVAKSVAWRQKYHISNEGKVPAWPASTRRAPAPGSYNPRFSDKPSIPKPRLGPRTVTPSNLGEPGPNRYKAEKDEFSKTAHAFGLKSKPSFPTILNYVEHTMSGDIPAPANCHVDFSKNSAPKSKMGTRLKKPVNTVPAPNHYTPEKPNCHVPQFSITSKLKEKTDNGIPGPGSYTINTKPETPLFKMTGRPKNRKAETTPGPNAYNLSNINNSKKSGATLKGRPSPFVYSGFKNTARVSTLCS